MSYTIEAGTPSVADYLRLREAGGLSPFSAEAARAGLVGTWFGVVVVSGGRPIGMGRIIGDGGCFFQVVDIVVEADHRGHGLGKRIMAALMDQLEAHAPPSAFVSLMADVPADRLYARFGFRPTAPRSIGMMRRVLVPSKSAARGEG